MNVRNILIAGTAALAMMAGGSTFAATATPDQPGGYGMMQKGQGPGPWWMMGNGPDAGTEAGWLGMMHRGGMWGAPWMQGAGMMGGGMMGMMGGCPMMMGAGLDRKTAMRMRGEMMRAMGDILIKYADQVEPPASKP